MGAVKHLIFILLLFPIALYSQEITGRYVEYPEPPDSYKTIVFDTGKFVFTQSTKYGEGKFEIKNKNLFLHFDHLARQDTSTYTISELTSLPRSSMINVQVREANCITGTAYANISLSDGENFVSFITDNQGKQSITLSEKVDYNKLKIFVLDADPVDIPLAPYIGKQITILVCLRTASGRQFIKQQTKKFKILENNNGFLKLKDETGEVSIYKKKVD